MKKVGIIGGMSWQSTLEYYRNLNELSEKYGNGFSTIDIIIYSLNFREVEFLQRKNDWEGIEKLVSVAAVNLERAGADFLIIASNTIHKVLPAVKKRVIIPFYSIIDAIAEEIISRGGKKVALFGTRFTMEEDFYRSWLEKKSGAKILIPEKDDRERIDDIIYKELTKNIISEKSRMEVISIIAKMKKVGADGVILGCTELPLLISDEISPLSVYNSTEIHIKKSFAYSLNED